MTIKSLRLGALVTGLALTLAACGGSSGGTPSGAVDGGWDDVVAAAEKEGSVMLYSSHNPVNLESLKKAFEAEYPDITMEYVRGTDAELNPKVEVENQTGRGTADVHMVTDTNWINSAAESGTYSAELLGPEVTESGNYDDDTSLIADRFVLTSVAVFALGWNTDILPEGLGDVTDVIKPELKGKIGIVNPTGIAVYNDLYRFLENTYGEEFIEDLASLEPRIYPSSLGIAQALTSGEIAAAPIVNTLGTEKASGAPVDWKLAPEPWGAAWYTHVLSSAAHPNAGQVLADFMASEEGQTALSAGYAATLPGIEGAVAQASDVTLADPSDLTADDLKARESDWESLFLN
ncbi:extracellular solute-binding protein [Nocardioides eburneiflavus]|uniref:Extracellular solute-binding protein n=1 Tax=Nocardioides eburneiflavus TaxID=2518372 RepID=A0A4Z1CIT2_9ACTN|nr:extracellular solute-binding protein [Nocardioides eburneiflavus]TGN66047.1 extracellular solute-binding protein [Nocardioides eburneiflavus]